jgi:hypothetical protein
MKKGAIESVARRATAHANTGRWRPLTLSEAHALWQQRGGAASASARVVWLLPGSPPAARADHPVRRMTSHAHALGSLLLAVLARAAGVAIDL